MTETKVLQRITDVDAELIEQADTFRVRKRKKQKVFLFVAVVFLLLVGVVSVWLYYDGNKVELDENGKIDIYSLKGAEKTLENTYVGSTEEYAEASGYSISPKEEYLSMLKREIEASRESFVYGTVQNMKTIKIEDQVRFSRMIWEHLEDGSSIQKKRSFDYPVTWWIVTFDINVIDDMGTLDGRESVHVVLASRYATGDTGGDFNYKLQSPERMKKIVEEIQTNPTGLFELRNIAEDPEERLDDKGFSSHGNIWIIKGKEYRALDFADYLFWERYDCDGEKFQYASADFCTVFLDELRIQEEE